MFIKIIVGYIICMVLLSILFPEDTTLAIKLANHTDVIVIAATGYVLMEIIISIFEGFIKNKEEKKIIA